MRLSARAGPPERLPPGVLRLAGAARDAGGRALVAGGWVRDRLLGVEPRDVDVEILGLGESGAQRLLERFGRVRRFGKAFGVWRVDGIDADFSPAGGLEPRPIAGGSGLAEAYREAARRRDLTINAIAYDPLADEVLDPWGGRADLEARRLRATDATRFGEDPLRGLRVARLLARHRFDVDDELERLCAALAVEAVAVERLLDESTRLLLEPERPAPGFRFLSRTGLLRFAPEVMTLSRTGPGEGPPGFDRLGRTLAAVDAAAVLHGDLGPGDSRALMWAALTHDLGGPERGGSAPDRERHESSARLAERLLARLRAPGRLVEAVATLVRHQDAPADLGGPAASPAELRRLARRSAAHGASLELLARLARALHAGAPAPHPGGRQRVDAFLEAARTAGVAHRAPRDVVLGRHLVERGLAPGPRFSALLARCREVQDETGWDEPGPILGRVLEGTGGAS